MQAFILAAGLGTRLKPLTDSRPKALAEVQGRTLIELAIDNLAAQGIRHIVVNTHHFSEMLVRYIQSRQWDADIIISDEREMLLDTGGGLKKAARYFNADEPILIHNVDILSHIDFHAMEMHHADAMNIATLAASQRNTSRQLLFDVRGRLAGWRNSQTGEEKWVGTPMQDIQQLAFSGIAIIQPELLGLLPEADRPYPIIPHYLEIAKEHRISYFKHKKEDWLDIGKPDTLALAQKWNFNTRKQ